jgi:hypothetical protein
MVGTRCSLRYLPGKCKAFVDIEMGLPMVAFLVPFSCAGSGASDLGSSLRDFGRRSPGSDVGTFPRSTVDREVPACQRRS